MFLSRLTQVTLGDLTGRTHLAAVVLVHRAHGRLESYPCHRSTRACARSGGGRSPGYPFKHAQQAREVRHAEITIAFAIERLLSFEK